MGTAKPAPGVSDSAEDPRERCIREFIATLDEAELSRRYREDDGLIVLPRLLPQPLVEEMAAEARRLMSGATRKWAPFVRKAGAVGHAVIAREAPAMHALHQSPALMALFERVTGVPLAHRDPDEAHASALYTYTRRGDWMDWHYDECGCPPEISFSTVVGLIDNSSARLELESRCADPEQPPLRRSLQTAPGTFAFFCGSRVRHRVTPLAEDEERVTLAFTYLRKGHRPSGIYNLRMRLGNALIYFGLGSLFRRR